MKAVVFTLGCKVNECESDSLISGLVDLGYEVSDKLVKADLYIVNTCAVTNEAEKKSRQMASRIRKLSPNAKIIFTGCAVQKDPKQFEDKSDDFLLTGVFNKNEILSLLSEKGNHVSAPCETFEELLPVKSLRTRDYVKVQDGCNNFCSYCIVPYTRGRERSRCSADIIAECRELISSGVCEITLLGQNVNSYSADISFPELLSAIARLEGKFILRFMTSHPKDVSAELVRVMGKYPEKIAPAFHLPLQSGSDRVLLDMNRRYTKQSFIDTADMIKAGVTDVYLTTDVIVGYPGESEEDFIETLDVLSRVRFDAVYAFLYSPREGTVAARRADTVEHSVKKRRLSQLLQLQDEILISKNRELIGRVFTVLCESCEGETSRGRACSGRPVHFDRKNAAPGKYVKVKITSVGAYGLVGCEVE